MIGGNLVSMLGTRGCRLAIVHPEIYEMRARAIMARGARRQGAPRPRPAAEVMIPLIDYERELEILRELVHATATDEGMTHHEDHLVGTMIELPRACFLADTIAEPGVGQLVRMGAWLGRKAKPGLKLGVCGEHGGDPDSIDFFHRFGIDYVSCSPFRVPVARVAAAQAAIPLSPPRRAGPLSATTWMGTRAGITSSCSQNCSSLAASGTLGSGVLGQMCAGHKGWARTM